MNKLYIAYAVAGVSLLSTITVATYLLIQKPTTTFSNSLIVSDYETIDKSDLLVKDEYFASLPTEAISPEEKAGLLLMREEEKLAHDVYTKLYEKWNQNIFNNISDSEQTHTDMVKELLSKYSIEDPSANKAIGEFTNPDLTKLYNQLVSEGSKSISDGLKIGATVEDLDISDLQKLTINVNNADILTVYNNLEKGSRNHLRSFTRLLNRNGVTYTPTYISQTQYMEIINSPSENGIQLDSKGNRR
jgi:hypothetical protein